MAARGRLTAENGARVRTRRASCIRLFPLASALYSA